MGFFDDIFGGGSSDPTNPLEADPQEFADSLTATAEALVHSRRQLLLIRAHGMEPKDQLVREYVDGKSALANLLLQVGTDPDNEGFVARLPAELGITATANGVSLIETYDLPEAGSLDRGVNALGLAATTTAILVVAVISAFAVYRLTAQQAAAAEALEESSARLNQKLAECLASGDFECVKQINQELRENQPDTGGLPDAIKTIGIVAVIGVLALVALNTFTARAAGSVVRSAGGAQES